MTTPTITPLEHAQFESIDPCFDPSMPDHDMPGRLEVDLAFGEETVFSFPEVVDADGHWAIEVFREFEDGTPAPLDVGVYRLAVHCLPADDALTEPVVNYEPLTFTVAEATTPAPQPEPEPAPAPAQPVVRTPNLTG